MNWKTLFIIGLGGFVGTVCRYLVYLITQKWIPHFPSGTLIVNLLGCFAIGLLFAWFEKGASWNASWRLFLITGFCGGFTTFSAFALENNLLFEEGRFRYLILYLLASVVLGYLAAWGGIQLVRRF